MSLTFQEKCALARKSKISDVWKHKKTGRTVVIVGHVGSRAVLSLMLKHESGRVTQKQDHYFAYDYDPVEQLGVKDAG